MTSQFKRHLPVQGTYNVRDLGGYPTATGETLWRRVLRSDGLHRLDDAGMDVLVAEGVGTVIDLRHANELETHPNPFGLREGVAYHNVSLFDLLAPAKLEQGDVLLELYKEALEKRQSAIAEVLTIIADAPEGAVLFHCTAGKDRTGIISALMLAVVGVEAAVIVEDYALTGPMIAPMVEEIIADMVARGGSIEQFRPMLATDPATMAATIVYLVESYGSVDDYLAHIGLDTDTVARLRQRLVGEA